MVKKIGKGNEAHYSRKEDESGKDRQYKIVGKGRRNLKCVMPHQIAVRAGEGPLHAAESHYPSIVRHMEWSHTRKTVLRRLRNDGHDFDVVLLVFEMNQHRVVSTFQEQVHGNFSATKAPNG